MTDAVWNVAAYTLQLGALVLVALASITALRVQIPTHLLRFWQCVLAIALLLPLAQPWGSTTTMSASPNFTAAARIINTPREAFVARLQGDWLQAVIVIIAIGIVARLGWLAVGVARVRTLVSNARRESSLGPVFNELQGTLGVTATVLVSDSLEGPATIGVRQPIVLVPEAVTAMPPAVQRAILCHELLHVKRRDWLNTIGEEVWCAILWFHPLARVIASRLSLSREMVVDEQTILLTRDRRAYAEALLAFSNPQPHVIGVTPFIGRNTLSQRIALIAQEVSMSRRRALLSMIIAMAASVAVSASAVDRFPMSVSAQPDNRVFDLGPGISAPAILHEVKPDYTRAAMDAKIQGSVWMGVVVSASGDVTQVAITRSLDAEYGLDARAMEAAYQWKFKPATKDGKPVNVRVTLEMTFTLK